MIESKPIVLKNKIFYDNRGYFREYFRKNIYSKKINASYLQDSFSISKKNVLRGLHYRTNQQFQLITLVRGKIFDVVVNINKKSPNYGKVFEYYLDENKYNQIILPKYYAHGFCVISEEAIINYKTDKYYNPKFEKGIIWNDKKLNINWPISRPKISKRDRLFGKFNDI
tara:strand:+ start:517 stop:1023 length:507 start_codon:yes stop_codon:yes gene_type:complete